ncbi:hypothetical protein CEP54_005144 [Fusarium duplospermum]|uniref:C2H2-type domain-containing protein n=1 Tax=Fusarium duplospermum TaxID=1325734 RepID=A0A428QE71_9HYPO|nr:hypothetical protein CEP54_005144 [Fusarium duplospermum]
MQARPNPESPTSRRLSHIDGLLAGFNVLASGCPIDGQKQQWDRLEQLRGEMRHQWERLADVPLAVNDLEWFCDTALFAYRNALAGLVPTDLPKVVGLCSLSYAVSRILEREGTPSSENFLDDVRVCLQSLEKQEERQKIETSMTQLWPATVQAFHVKGELSTHQHQNLPYYPRGSVYSGAVSEPWQIQNVPSLPYPSTALHVPPSGLSVSAAWVNIPQSSFEPQGSALDTADYSALGWIPGATLNAVPETPWSGSDQTEFQVGSIGQLGATCQQRAVSAARSGPQCVQDTALFNAIDAFLDGSAELLTLLSGNGITAKNLGACLSSNQERLKDKEHLQSSYMAPLLKRQDLSQAPSRVILSIANKFVAYGCLQNIAEVQSYMITVAEELFSDQTAQKRFAEQSAQARAVICPDCGHGFSKQSNLTRHQRNNQCLANRNRGSSTA